MEKEVMLYMKRIIVDEAAGGFILYVDYGEVYKK
jgi:hypothetical protein